MTPPAQRIEEGVERGAPFPGFVARGVATTLPAQFFAELLPLIDDEAELRVTLYALYAIGRRKGTLRAVRVSQLASEEPLRRALAGCGGDAALTPSIERAVARGSLLTLDLEDGDTLCFMNSAAGRRNRERLRSGALKPPPGVSIAAPREQRGAIEVDAPARVYEQEIGALTPEITDALDAAAERWPADWIVRALRLAARHNVRRWAYAESILRRWEAEGVGEEGGTADAEPGADHARAERRDHGPYERVIRRS
ncbi:MAG: DnaD domain protein [Chloroflexi bacterium]|nr:DnaD domain protein [Chloroflexota bacterium]